MSPRARLAWLLAVPVVLAYAYCALRLLAAQLTREMALVGSAFVPSDLFVPWLGARALLAGRSPYTVEFANQLHQLVYGHVVTPSADFQNVATFQYPPFVLAYLFPLMPLPFELVRWLAVALLALCLVLSSHLWLRLVSPSSTRATQAGVGLASVLFFPSLQTLVLQQLSGLVVLLLVAGAYHAARRRVVLAGILLGLAMLKPQLAALPVLSVVVWSVLRPDRRRLALSCGLTVTALLALSYLVLGDWPRQFLVALDRYRAYNTVYWVPEKLLGHTPAIAFSAAVLAILAWRWW
ncbi:MAG TPA: glycosyltransferase family 87 protein, partial [Chloroflexota bacterium]|nr:glycosyltransferase family 87 protein [Chloroflexota bacterium]